MKGTIRFYPEVVPFEGSTGLCSNWSRLRASLRGAFIGI